MTVAEIARGSPPDQDAAKRLASPCHPEAAKTSKDLSSGEKVTRIAHRGVVNPDATIVFGLPAVGCDVDFDGRFLGVLRLPRNDNALWGVTLCRGGLTVAGINATVRDRRYI